jgi:predicted lipid-binding transport protein (Tim44 family)
VALPSLQGRQGECIGEDAGARDLSVCLVLGLVLAGIGTGGATGAAVAYGVVIVLAVGAFVVMTVFFIRWAGPPSPYSRTGAARQDDDRPTACGTAAGTRHSPGAAAKPTAHHRFGPAAAADV